jgi:hypothetical protein
MQEVRILSLLASVRAVPDGSRLLVDARDLHDRTFAVGDLALQRPRLQVVEIELPPVVTL